MDMLVDTAFAHVARREPAASAVAAREQPLQAAAAAASLSRVAVSAVAEGDKAKTAAGDDRRRDAADRPPPLPSRSGSMAKVELQFNYEQELNRTFIDLVGRESDSDRVVRMPPEQLVRYIEQMKAESRPVADEAPRLDALA